MSNLSEIVDSLENRISKLLHRYEALKKNNLKLEEELALEIQNHSKTMNDLELWKEQINSLKIANAMLGSDQYKRETKLKINALVREIDLCIAQLSE
ncbi:MAG: hypothetical protein COZ75_02785 [Flavobacteriaceae bacterium CG_4_8_14_3_um_filter_34_10]|nr:hypothetical protein [Flavobacteriia bacterium]OIP49108.1 MAG: hypothetical protein AUK33_11160 [Flavobacteriaceae bacterium CG2_30_34_30]PIQ19587.1 MAG: hypothetical protein COW66_00250 [Flavobacteriaceae bacterium CG18_big_fil_WC_8_21_14_2_50_34_36]PIV50007.1 MAG: hypothetical protein COS19_05765 [Flavobacteriaceae bacterium CG02_land_8_20_14_3_00_34_13]PIX10208.1 MAG: hypothetical protein COZ75_02785 [Flavobacteriaceae bacterium CG_4_8_14_3_um_filter_34_10]PIZ07596.1 MAG: hypothetical pr